MGQYFDWPSLVSFESSRNQETGEQVTRAQPPRLPVPKNLPIVESYGPQQPLTT